MLHFLYDLAYLTLLSIFLGVPSSFSSDVSFYPTLSFHPQTLSFHCSTIIVTVTKNEDD